MPAVLGRRASGFPGAFALAPLPLPRERQSFAVVAHAQERGAAVVVHQLGVDVLDGAEDDQPRPLRRPRHLLPDPEMAAVALLLPGLRQMNRAHFLGSRLAGLAADPLALVADPLPLVRLGRPDLGRP